MGAYVCQAALMRASIASDAWELRAWAFIWTLLAGVIGVIIPYSKIGKQPSSQGQSTGQSNAWALHARDVLLLLAVAPLAILLTFAVATALDAQPSAGRQPGRW